jgi:hypothetical protein
MLKDSKDSPVDCLVDCVAQDVLVEVAARLELIHPLDPVRLVLLSAADSHVTQRQHSRDNHKHLQAYGEKGEVTSNWSACCRACLHTSLHLAMPRAEVPSYIHICCCNHT